MSEAFRVWLSQELEQRSWSHRELARQIGVSQSLVSQTLAGERKPSINFCKKVAHLFKESPEKLFRLAEILPSAPRSDDDTLQELIELARNLPVEDQKEILEYVRFRYHRRKD